MRAAVLLPLVTFNFLWVVAVGAGVEVVLGLYCGSVLRGGSGSALCVWLCGGSGSVLCIVVLWRLELLGHWYQMFVWVNTEV